MARVPNQGGTWGSCTTPASPPCVTVPPVLIDLDASPCGSAPSRPAQRRSGLSSGRPALAAAVALALTLASSLAVAQTDEEKAAARSLATQGGESLAASRYAEAFDLVTRAEQLVHAPTHLSMIARSLTGMGRLVAAKETYLRLLREDLSPSAPPAFKRAQAEAKDELAALEPRISQIRISLEGAGQKKVTVKMDDQAVSPALLGVYRPIDPGKHEVVAYPAGQNPVKGSIELRDGERKEIKLSIPDASSGVNPPGGPVENPNAQWSPPPLSGAQPLPPPGGYSRPPGFFTPLRSVGLGLTVLGAAGVGIGAVFVVNGFGLSRDADDKLSACGMRCSPVQEFTIRDLDVKAAGRKNIGVGVMIGGFAAATAGVIMLVVGKPRADPNAAYVTPWVSGNAAGLLGAF